MRVRKIIVSLIIAAILGVLLGNSMLRHFRRPVAEQPSVYALFEFDQEQETLTPSSEQELKKLLAQAHAQHRVVSVVGAGKSQGGQTWSREPAMRISLEKMNRLLHFDNVNKKITVQSGMIWRELQKIIAPHGLAVRSMQSYNDFSIGGSLSVNVHGQDVHDSALIKTVESFRLMRADGSIINVSRAENSELFGAVIGGYGLFGVILDATLMLTDDYIMQKKSEVVNADRLAEYMLNIARSSPLVEFISGRFSLDSCHLLEKVLVISYEKTELHNPALFTFNTTGLGSRIGELVLSKALTLTHCSLIARKLRFPLEKFFERPALISRNNFMGYSINTLPQDTDTTSYILQEYFIPYDQLNSFIEFLKQLYKTYDLKLINLTARHINKHSESVLSISDRECCALVLYAHQSRNQKAYENTLAWTRELIDAALERGGTYYLPYHHLATREQFWRAYPRAQEFIDLKLKYDPEAFFSNEFWRYYLAPS